MLYFAVGTGILARKAHAVSVKRDISRPLIFRYAVRRAAAKFLPENFRVFFCKNIAVALAYPLYFSSSSLRKSFRSTSTCLFIRLFYSFGQKFLYSVHKLSSCA